MRFLRVLLAFTVATGGCSSDRAPQPDGPSCLGGKCDDGNDLGATEFEYIVVGSGAGGGPLASNLARAGHSVLLLEAGADMGGKLDSQVPAFNTRAAEDPDLTWNYFVKHYEDDSRGSQDSKWVADEAGVLYPRGATLGGSTANNAMITVYPHESDWSRIANTTGDSSWNPYNMRSYFARLERNGYLTFGNDLTGHGFTGWLGVERVSRTLALDDDKITAVVYGAALALNPLFPYNELAALWNFDLNSAWATRDNYEGLYAMPLATSQHKRNGTREYILDTVNGGYPLTVKMHALVSKVIFDGSENGKPRAVGVEFLAGAHLYQADPNHTSNEGTKRIVKATREVIVSAGAFNTPQLLKLSGVGPRAELEQLGIPVAVDLPGVGANLQDRYEVGVVQQFDSDLPLLAPCTFGDTSDDPCLEQWQSQDGPYTSNGGIVGMVKRSTTSALDPDLFIFATAGIFKGYYPGFSAEGLDKRHVSWVVLKAHNRNHAGSVTLRSTDPRERPEIRFRYFEDGTTDNNADGRDLDAVADGVEYVREIIGQTATQLPSGSYGEVWPGDSVKTRDDIKAWIKKEAWGHHASGTAKIGADDDPMAVLDSKFRVRGTAGLRVVDASVFPEIPGFFLAVPIYMVSEKAADAILEDVQ